MERVSSPQAAAALGVDVATLYGLLQQHANRLPPFDAGEPDSLPRDVVDALTAILGSETPQSASGDEADNSEADSSEADNSEAEPQRRRKAGATIVAITSGKGGVGKTSTCVNLASELSARGLRTVIVDVDLGLANTHILAGMRPARTLCDYIEGRAELVDIVMDGPAGVKMISGGNGVKEMADLDESGRQRILDAINELRPFCDLILLDTAAGISRGVTDFVSISDHTLVVTTSNFAAIADAYGIIKVMMQDGYDRPMHVIINRVRSPEEAEQVFKKIQGCTQRFLNRELNWLGLLPEDNSVEGAVLQRKPFCQAFPDSVATRYLKKLASSLERYLPHVPSATV
jgi:flagellar biosynthesis protein FlhG